METAKIHLELGDCRRAVVECTNVVRVPPHHLGTPVEHDRPHAQLHQGELGNYPQHIDALVCRGIARTTEGPLKHARLDLQQAEELKPDHQVHPPPHPTSCPWPPPDPVLPPSPS
jgi:hypothetical protein